MTPSVEQDWVKIMKHTKTYSVIATLVFFPSGWAETAEDKLYKLFGVAAIAVWKSNLWHYSKNIYLPPANEVWGKVMFYTRLSFCLQRGVWCHFLSACLVPCSLWRGGGGVKGMWWKARVCGEGDRDPLRPEAQHLLNQRRPLKRAVRILLECILVVGSIFKTRKHSTKMHTARSPTYIIQKPPDVNND